MFNFNKLPLQRYQRKIDKMKIKKDKLNIYKIK